MMNHQQTFHLSLGEAEYISKLISDDNSFRESLRSRLEIREGGGTLILDHAEAERTRDYFTDRLARVGFDKDYKPNDEGVMLERLTDKLFLPEWPTR
jgi:hypothetical protein